MSTWDIDGAQNHRLTRLPVDKPFDDYSDVSRAVGSTNPGKSPFIHKQKLNEIYGIDQPFKYTSAPKSVLE